MHEELAEATRLIDELVGLEHFEVIQMASKSKGARFNGPRDPKSMTIGELPVMTADKRGILYLERNE